MSGGTTSQRATITDAAGLNDAIASQLLGLDTQQNASSTTDGVSPLLSDVTNTSELKDAITNALLGGTSSEQSVEGLAALGATLNGMVETAQSALATTSTTLRSQALSTYQGLYASLDQSAASIDGTAGNAASLGLAAPGDWTNSDATVAAAAITLDMTAAVKAHTVVQEMIQSVGATLLQSYLIGP